MPFTHLDEVLAEVEPLGRLFREAGFRLFLVGGIVRDQWRDDPLDASSDIDLTTDARPADIKQIVTAWADDLWTQGERFGTIGLRAAGRDYEITTHRAESYASDSRKPEVSFGDDIELDLSRRDFTVNAMAIELPHGELVDPFGGVVDLAAHSLRTPLSAEISFTDDPLRMLRAARFSTKYGLAPVDELEDSAAELHQRLRIVAIERIGVETQRLLGLSDASSGLAFLCRTGLLAEVLGYGAPELLPAIQDRLVEAIATAGRLDADWRLRLAAIGITTFDDAEGVGEMCQRLKLSRDDERYIVGIATSALQVGSEEPNRESLRRWAAQANDRGAAIELASVVVGPTKSSDFADGLGVLAAREDLDTISLLSGDQIMATLNEGPGAVIGAAVTFLRECYFERGPLTEVEQIGLIKTWQMSDPTSSKNSRPAAE